MSIVLKPAEDAVLLYDMIRELAEHEDALHKLKATVEGLRATVCSGKYANGFIIYIDDVPAGYIIYFFAYSTYNAAPTLYIEDIYIKDEHRSKGAGAMVMSYMARLAVKSGCPRLDFTCIEGNPRAIKFYERLGCKYLTDRRYYRAEGDTLITLCDMFKDE